MTNILLIIVFNLFLYLFFYKLISNKWLPNKNTVITIIIGILLVPLAIILERYFKDFSIITEKQYNLLVAVIEEILKLTPILILLNFIKHRKFTFIEILGIGIGFAFWETILYGKAIIISGSNLYTGLSASITAGFLTTSIRFLGTLILHTLTVGIMGLALICLKNKRKLLILIVLPTSIYIHYLFNINVSPDKSENFLWILLIIGVLFILMFSLYIFIKSKVNDSAKIKIIILEIGKFILKYIILFIFWFCLFGAIDSINFSGLPRYSSQEIEQAKIDQNKSTQITKSWQSEDITKRFNESAEDLSKLRALYIERDNTYSFLVKTMEENRKLTEEEEQFLKSKGSNLTKEIQLLSIKIYTNSWKKDISGMIVTQNNYSDFFKNNNPSGNIKLDYSNFKEISNYIINTDRLIITKLELHQELTEQEINYSLDERTKKMDELINVFNRVNKFIEIVLQ